MNENTEEMRADQTREGGTQVLSEEERRSFDGITLEEDGSTYEEKKVEDPFSTFGSFGSEQGAQEGMPFKVYTLSSISWKWKLLAGLVVAAVIAIVLSILFFFGSFIVVGIVTILAIMVLMRIIRSLLS